MWSLLLLVFLAWALLAFVRRKLVKPDYHGKTVWITGGSSGIGEYLAYEFSRRGASLILSARNLQELQRVKNSCSYPESVQVVEMDMSDLAGM